MKLECFTKHCGHFSTKDHRRLVVIKNCWSFPHQRNYPQIVTVQQICSKARDIFPNLTKEIETFVQNVFTLPRMGF